MQPNEPVTLQLPQLPTIAITNGAEASLFTDRYRSGEGTTFRPMEKASVVARLRALADEIENAKPL